MKLMDILLKEVSEYSKLDKSAEETKEIGNRIIKLVEDINECVDIIYGS